MGYAWMPEKLFDYMLRHRQFVSARNEVAEKGGEIVTHLLGKWKCGVRPAAKRLGVSYGYLSKVQRGVEVMSPELAERVAEALLRMENSETP